MDATVTTLPATAVRSLAWCRDGLIDWAGGGRTFALDGPSTPRRFGSAYPFDDVRTSDSGEYVLQLVRLGTKGLVLHNGRVLREVNRSYYHADRYDYPAAFFRLPDGRDVLAHCPDEYNRVEIEELPTFRRLTPPGDNRSDFFHSRLVANPSGTRLMSGGWAWHPVRLVEVLDVGRAVAGDGPAAWTLLRSSAEVDDAAWLSDDRIATATAAGSDDFEEGEADRSDAYYPGAVGVYDVVAGAFVSVRPCDDWVGHLMPVGPSHAVGFHGHPKLVDLSTGRVVYRWPGLDTGPRSGPIDLSGVVLPPLAIDGPRRRFAVASGTAITIVQLPDVLPAG